MAAIRNWKRTTSTSGSWSRISRPKVPWIFMMVVMVVMVIMVMVRMAMVRMMILMKRAPVQPWCQYHYKVECTQPPSFPLTSVWKMIIMTIVIIVTMMALVVMMTALVGWLQFWWLMTRLWLLLTYIFMRFFMRKKKTGKDLYGKQEANVTFLKEQAKVQ